MRLERLNWARATPWQKRGGSEREHGEEREGKQEEPP